MLCECVWYIVFGGPDIESVAEKILYPNLPLKTNKPSVKQTKEIAVWSVLVDS